MLQGLDTDQHFLNPDGMIFSRHDLFMSKSFKYLNIQFYFICYRYLSTFLSFNTASKIIKLGTYIVFSPFRPKDNPTDV